MRYNVDINVFQVLHSRATDAWASGFRERLMHVSPHLPFDGRCEEAFRFYAELTGGRIDTLLRWRDMPGGTIPPGWDDKIMHAHLIIGGSAILGADSPPGRYTAPRGVSLSLDAADAAAAERLFAALAAGGTVQMKLDTTFFAARFGMLTDRFAIPWMVLASG